MVSDGGDCEGRDCAGVAEKLFDESLGVKVPDFNRVIVVRRYYLLVVFGDRDRSSR